MIEVVAVAPLRAEVVTGAVLARSIIAALPRSCSHLLPADQLALCSLLGGCGSMGVTKVASQLGLPASSTVELVDRAVHDGRVLREKIGPATRAKDGRYSIVTLTAKAKRERRRARGAERFGL